MKRMKCKDCEHFHIKRAPWKYVGKCQDLKEFGLVECKKYNLFSGFYGHEYLNRFRCIKDMESADSKDDKEIMV